MRSARLGRQLVLEFVVVHLRNSLLEVVVQLVYSGRVRVQGQTCHHSAINTGIHVHLAHIVWLLNISLTDHGVERRRASHRQHRLHLRLQVKLVHPTPGFRHLFDGYLLQLL